MRTWTTRAAWLGALLTALGTACSSPDEGSTSQYHTEDGGCPDGALPCERPLCAPMDVTALGDCMARLGFAFDGSACYSLGGCTCEGVDCASMYGTLSECETATSGCGVCTPMDASAVGDCMAMLGFAYDGSECQALGGCTCEGDDCERLYSTQAECEDATAICG